MHASGPPLQRAARRVHAMHRGRRLSSPGDVSVGHLRRKHAGRNRWCRRRRRCRERWSWWDCKRGRWWCREWRSGRHAADGRYGGVRRGRSGLQSCGSLDCTRPVRIDGERVRHWHPVGGFSERRPRVRHHRDAHRCWDRHVSKSGHGRSGELLRRCRLRRVRPVHVSDTWIHLSNASRHLRRRRRMPSLVVRCGGRTPHAASGRVERFCDFSCVGGACRRQSAGAGSRADASPGDRFGQRESVQ